MRQATAHSISFPSRPPTTALATVGGVSMRGEKDVMKNPPTESAKKQSASQTTGILYELAVPKASANDVSR